MWENIIVGCFSLSGKISNLSPVLQQKDLIMMVYKEIIKALITGLDRFELSRQDSISFEENTTTKRICETMAKNQRKPIRGEKYCTLTTRGDKMGIEEEIQEKVECFVSIEDGM